VSAHLPEGDTHSLHPDSDPREIAKRHMTQAGEKPPDHIGLYRILETLGEGGMGTVYLAEQTKPIHRRVALKIIKLGMDTRQVSVIHSNSTRNRSPHSHRTHHSALPSP
jgi:serine/threonine protein kinase